MLEEALSEGSALSCTLFLIFINDLAKHLAVQKALFADDLVIWVSDKYPILSKTKLNRALATIASFCELWKLQLNIQKTCYTIFTLSPKTAKKHLNLRLRNENVNKEESPVYLGVTLDRQMNLSQHINSLKEKAQRRLNLVKRLASTSWGADKLTLRQLYLGYVRSVIDYNLPLQNLASKSSTTSLDRIQNQALRLICGGMKTTPVAACEIDANTEPLDIRRKRALLNSVERFRRQGEGHPNKILVENWKPTNRIQRRSLLDLAEQEEKKHHLPELREPEIPYLHLPPWENFSSPAIQTKLKDTKVSKATLPTILKTCAQETIDSYPATAAHAYTDGSAFKGTMYAGFGVFLKFPDGTTLKHSEPCGNNRSNYEAEANAIKTAAQLIHQSIELNEKEVPNLVIFSDSSSVLDAIKNESYNNKAVFEAAQAIHNLITAHNVQTTLQWIPGHTDIHGNEVADQLAKSGASSSHFENSCSLQTVQQILRNNYKEDWSN